MEKHLILCVYARDRSHDLELLFFILNILLLWFPILVLLFNFGVIRFP